LYVLRSQVPLFSFGNDLALSAAFGEDYYGRTKDPAQVLASRIVKIQTWDDDSTRDQIVRSLSGIDYRAKALKTQRSAIGNKYDKQVYELEDKLRDGEITQAKFDNSVKSAAEDYEKRSAALAEKEALLQEEFNTLDENVKSIGLNFKSILDKAD
jgi:chaperonin cofactor prefoldin